jgi:hypothetical protein
MKSLPSEIDPKSSSLIILADIAAQDGKSAYPNNPWLAYELAKETIVAMQDSGSFPSDYVAFETAIRHIALVLGV